MTINQAITLANINDRAQRITQDYSCTILSDSVLVTRKGEPGRSYEVKDGNCACPSFDEHQTCKHILGLPDLLNAEINRLAELSGILEDKANCFEAIRNGREILDAHLCEMDIEAYRANITRALDLV